MVICQCHQTILRLFSSAATANTRWRVRKLCLTTYNMMSPITTECYPSFPTTWCLLSPLNVSLHFLQCDVSYHKICCHHCCPIHHYQSTQCWGHGRKYHWWGQCCMILSASCLLLYGARSPSALSASSKCLPQAKVITARFSVNRMARQPEGNIRQYKGRGRVTANKTSCCGLTITAYNYVQNFIYYFPPNY